MLAGVCLLVAPSANAVLIDVAANDVETGYTTGNGTIDSQSDLTAAFVTSANNPALAGADVEFSITLTGPNVIVFGSQWTGGNSAGADLIIRDEITGIALLELEIISMTGGTSTFGPPGGSNTSITIGSLDEVSPSRNLQITGGTLAGSFGGLGADAHLSLLISKVSIQINDAFGIGVLGQNFTGTTNLQLGFVATPEPGTAALVGVGLVGLSMWRRGRRVSPR